MPPSAELEIFLAATPGLESVLLDEARALRFREPQAVPGGVAVRGGWSEVWRANLQLRGAGRVLVRVGDFYAVHLAQLDKRARRLDWGAVLKAEEPVRVDATCQKSRIWHAGAAAERIGRAIVDGIGAKVAADAETRVLVRIVEDRCTISLDTSGEPLHRRGAKLAVGKAPLRETLAALFLRACGYRGDEPVVDPMCGSGTFVLEAAEVAAGLQPGRGRHFAFERLAAFDHARWDAMRRDMDAGRGALFAPDAEARSRPDAGARTELLPGVDAEGGPRPGAGAGGRPGPNVDTGGVPRPDVEAGEGPRPNSGTRSGVRLNVDSREVLRPDVDIGKPAFFGFDRDAGAVGMSQANAERAGVGGITRFAQASVSALVPPGELDGRPGLVMVNPPYGERIGEKGDLFALYGTLGRVLREQFRGWRVGVVTSDGALAGATGLPFKETSPPVPHGPLKVRLYRTDVLG